MKSNSDPAYHAIAAINARFRHNEHLSPKDALNYVRGKHRPARSPQAFIHGGPPPAKRPHLDSAGPSRETGRYIAYPPPLFLSFFSFLFFPSIPGPFPADPLAYVPSPPAAVRLAKYHPSHCFAIQSLARPGLALALPTSHSSTFLESAFSALVNCSVAKST
jgi:hypothetical protein